MSYYQVSSSEIRNSANELTGLNAEFLSSKEALIQCEQGLRNMWEGEANEAFHAAFIRDSGQMDAFHGAIEQYISALNVIADRYDAAELRNAQKAASRTYA